jgi:hypothetical protein
MQVSRIVFMIGMKAMLEGKLGRERDRSAVLEALSPGLPQGSDRTLARV